MPPFSEDAEKNIRKLQDLKPICDEKENAGRASRNPVDIDILELSSFESKMKSSGGKGEPDTLTLYYVLNWVTRNMDIKDTARQKALILVGKNFIFRKALSQYVEEVKKKKYTPYTVEYMNACSEIMAKTDKNITDMVYQKTISMWLRYMTILKKRAGISNEEVKKT